MFSDKKGMVEHQEKVRKLREEIEESKMKLKTLEVGFIKQISLILTLMGDAELTIHREEEFYNNKELDFVKPSWCYERGYNGIDRFRISRISYKENGFMIKYYFVRDLGEGDTSSLYYKSFVPYSYLSMDKNTIRKEHQIWARQKFRTILRKKKIKKLQQKIKDDELQRKNEYELYITLKEKFETENS